MPRIIRDLNGVQTGQRHGVASCIVLNGSSDLYLANFGSVIKIPRSSVFNTSINQLQEDVSLIGTSVHGVVVLPQVVVVTAENGLRSFSNFVEFAFHCFFVLVPCSGSTAGKNC